MVAIFAVPALAQTTAPAPAGIDTTSLRATLGTITGIAALALFVVQGVKWVLAKYKIGILSELPTPIFVAAVAMGLTVLASLVFKTLPGDTIDLVWQAMFAAAGSSAVFSWVKNGLDSPTTPKTSQKSGNTIAGIALIALLLPLSGCTWSTATMTPEQRLGARRDQAIAARKVFDGVATSILIAGKGHETYQLVGDKVLSFDDAAVVRDCLGQTDVLESVA